MWRLFTHAANLSQRVCICISVRTCLFPFSLFLKYMYIYTAICVHTCVYLSVHLCPTACMALSSGSQHPDSSFAVLPASLAPHLSIHLTKGFTLLTVKFTHIHNYVFNQSHLKAKDAVFLWERQEVQINTQKTAQAYSCPCSLP